MVDLTAVPDHLLAPLLDAAATALQELPETDVPAVARSLVGFDRRGLSRGPARRQLRRALADDDGFRVAVFTAFAARDDVQALLSVWSAGAVLANASAWAGRGELAGFASAVVAGEPDGADVALGIALGLDAAGRAAETEAQDARSSADARRAAEEAHRRLAAARDDLVRERDELTVALRDARRARRESAQETARNEERDALREQVAALEGELAQARVRLDRAEAERERAVVRAKHAEAMQADAADRRRSAERDRDALTAKLSEVTTELRARREPAADARPAPARDRDVTRGRAASPRKRGRAQPNLPGGLVADSVAGADALLRTDSVLLVVDGYNVSKAADAGGPLAAEREWLIRALASLHLRNGADVVVVFDGDDTPAFGQAKRRGVRVVFSAAATDADSVVVSTVASTPLTVPVVVASSDGWVREHADTYGAVVVSAATLLGVLRRPT